MNEIRARIITQERGMYKISDGSQVKNATVSGKYMHTASTVSDYPAVGDYVVAEWPEDDSNAVILCMSLNNDFNIRRIERYLAVAYDSGATPVIVLTKSDLCDDIEPKLLEIHSVAFGIDVVIVSSLKGEYDELLNYIENGKTYAFMGSSGVGKSTLINKLVGSEIIATNGLRNDDKGRHTTTHRELITLENGAYLIDTPGMRELGMWDNDSGIDSVFSDIEELFCECKFSNCTHTKEPGCAIQRAISEGTLDLSRWESYLKLKNENAYAANGSQYLEAKREKFKEISKINKANRKNRY